MSDIRVFIADPDEQERDELVRQIEAASGLRLVGAVEPDEDGLMEVLSSEPDAVVVRMPSTERAIDLCRRMLDARPRIRCLVLASAEPEEAFTHAVLIGAAGIVRRERLSEQLKEASPSLLDEASRLLATHDDRVVDGLLDDLTPRQRDVALLVLLGATNSEIAERLDISPLTVRNYLSRILDRLGMRNRTQLAVGLAAALVSARQAPDGR